MQQLPWVPLKVQTFLNTRMLSPISPSRRKSTLKAQLENPQGSRKNRPKGHFWCSLTVFYCRDATSTGNLVNSYSVALPQDKLLGPVPEAPSQVLTEHLQHQVLPEDQHQGPHCKQLCFLKTKIKAGCSGRVCPAVTCKSREGHCCHMRQDQVIFKSKAENQGCGSSVQSSSPCLAAWVFSKSKIYFHTNITSATTPHSAAQRAAKTVSEKEKAGGETNVHACPQCCLWYRRKWVYQLQGKLFPFTMETKILQLLNLFLLHLT